MSNSDDLAVMIGSEMFCITNSGCDVLWKEGREKKMSEKEKKVGEKESESEMEMERRIQPSFSCVITGIRESLFISLSLSLSLTLFLSLSISLTLSFSHFPHTSSSSLSLSEILFA